MPTKAVKKIKNIVFKAPKYEPTLIIKKISSAGMQIIVSNNEFICLLQNYIINVYLSHNE